MHLCRNPTLSLTTCAFCGGFPRPCTAIHRTGSKPGKNILRDENNSCVIENNGRRTYIFGKLCSMREVAQAFFAHDDDTGGRAIYYFQGREQAKTRPNQTMALYMVKDGVFFFKLKNLSFFVKMLGQTTVLASACFSLDWSCFSLDWA